MRLSSNHVLKSVLLSLILVVPMISIAGELPADLRRRIEQSVAFVQVEGVDADDKPCRWTGSGFFVNPCGYLITNEHVFPGHDGRQASKVEIILSPGTSDERKVPAELIATHSTSDLALLVCKKAGENPETHWLPLGESSALTRTESVWGVGFPYGARVAVQEHPSVSIASGAITSLRHDKDGHLVWIDVDAVAAPGCSGGPLLNTRGQVVGVYCAAYAGFGRAVPVEHVRELLGQAALAVTFDPPVAPPDGGPVRVEVRAQGPCRRLLNGSVVIPSDNNAKFVLKKDSVGLNGKIHVRPEKSTCPEWLPVLITAHDELGPYQQVIALPLREKPKFELRCVVRSVTAKATKASGWAWDLDDKPELFAKVLLNHLPLKTTEHARNRLRFAHSTSTPCEFTCHAGDDIEVEMWDHDLRNHDYVGRIKFTAEPELTVREGLDQIERCEITVRKVPLRLPPPKRSP